MIWYNPLTWFKKAEFDEEEMKKKLEELHSSIKRSPENVENLHKLFMKYQAEIGQNLDKLKDKSGVNAQIQLIHKALDEAKEKIAEAKELKEAA